MLVSSSPTYSPSQHSPFPATVIPKTQASAILRKLDTDLREKVEHKNIWDRLAFLGALVLGITAIPITLSPWIAKTVIPKLIQKPSINNHFLGKHLAKYQDKTLIMKHLFQICGIANVLVYIYSVQVGLNTNQPSKLVARTISIAVALAQTFIPLHLALRSINQFSTGFWAAGGRNDIENYNHLAVRREFPKKEKLFSKNALYFVLDDLRHTASIEPWKNLAQIYKKRDTWSKPNSNLNAIASQLGFLSGFLALSTLLPGLSKTKPFILEKITPGLVFLSSLLSSMPETFRAWESRQEKDGKLVLFGSPIYIIGRSFALSNKNLHLNGLAGLGGGVFQAIGTNLTSKKHDRVLSYIEGLHQFSIQYPSLKASVVLNELRANPDLQKDILENIGHVRFDFLKSVLQQASLKEQYLGIPFERSLRDIVTAHNDISNTVPPKPDHHVLKKLNGISA